MNIIIANPVIVEHDAIGNDVLQQFKILSNHGFPVFLYAEKVEGDFRSFLLSEKELKSMLQDKETVLLYHHGTLWERGERLVNAAACTVLLKYHNVTPPSFFEEYSREYVDSAARGREQTERLAKNSPVTHFLAASIYNGTELASYGIPSERITILPPFHLIEEEKRTPVNGALQQRLSDGNLNVLFVGRLAPNKGHVHLIEIMHAYTCLYDRNIRLNIVGGLDPKLEGYYRDLVARISYYGLHDVISFKERVDFTDLITYYQASDVFLLMSDHEGFCVPILEAQFHGLPVMALERCAVKDTIGANQLLFPDPDYELIASGLHLVYKTPAIKQYLIEHGLINFEKYGKTALSVQFVEIISRFSSKK